MKWRLKDRTLEKKLNELSDGEFSENLCKQSSGHFISCFGDHLCFSIQNECVNKAFWQYRFAVFFSADEVEEVQEYNPNGWNEYPKVTPPEGVPMRVEIDTLTDEVRRDCAIFKNGRWFSEFGGRANYKIAGPVRRYRPWSED